MCAYDYRQGILACRSIDDLIYKDESAVALVLGNNHDNVINDTSTNSISINEKLCKIAMNVGANSVCSAKSFAAV